MKREPLNVVHGSGLPSPPGRDVREVPIHCMPERSRWAAASPSARSHRLGVRAYSGTARACAERLRAGRLLGALVGALRLQALRPPAAPAAVARRTRAAGARRERRC